MGENFPLHAPSIYLSNIFTYFTFFLIFSLKTSLRNLKKGMRNTVFSLAIASIHSLFPLEKENFEYFSGVFIRVSGIFLDYIYKNYPVILIKYTLYIQAEAPKFHMLSFIL